MEHDVLDATVPPAPFAADIRSHWLLDPAVVFLNHGSFGACPSIILEEQRRWRNELERQPVLFFERSAPRYLEEARAAVGKFVGAPAGEIGFVTNATEGVAAVIRSLDLSPGDELVTTTHAYDAVSNTLSHVAQQAGAIVTRVPISVPFTNPDALVGNVLNACSTRTKLVVVDHVTSVSALILPIERIIAGCDELGIDVLIDGAHAPGMLELNLSELGAAYYAGNFHKWVCAPKGAAFLRVRVDKQERLHPAIISNHYGSGYVEEFAWQGTRDITPWLSVPAAIEFMSELGWERVIAYQRSLVRWAHLHLARLWNVDPIAPLDGSRNGAMFTLPLPAGNRSFTDRFACTAALFAEHGVEAPVVEVEGRRMIRPSCQIYNTAHDYVCLGEAVLRLLQIE